MTKKSTRTISKPLTGEIRDLERVLASVEQRNRDDREGA
jgi:hypothetical protein